MTKYSLSIIQWYQRDISPRYGRRCRFEPTCSQYAKIAFEKYGFWRGCWLTFGRLRRCHHRYIGSKVDFP
ncbi:membrane protein insertion efficiency factor YidD [Fodinisporobacter ferrooxydans]|uniref:Putative membrane protein insertion efficiency factor n=1 Tax=Fodinisporobacter ferrooxydans TaxID=2901836 RepID=A0ABY4CQV1_9BACL|nr:membrane protein insertion efficiency factor YidD [Alicyclobacillaceae bacterium MYW30-H2]